MSLKWFVGEYELYESWSGPIIFGVILRAKDKREALRKLTKWCVTMTDFDSVERKPLNVHVISKLSDVTKFPSIYLS